MTCKEEARLDERGERSRVDDSDLRRRYFSCEETRPEEEEGDEELDDSDLQGRDSL